MGIPWIRVDDVMGFLIIVDFYVGGYEDGKYFGWIYTDGVRNVYDGVFVIYCNSISVYDVENGYLTWIWIFLYGFQTGFVFLKVLLIFG